MDFGDRYERTGWKIVLGMFCSACLLAGIYSCFEIAEKWAADKIEADLRRDLPVGMETAELEAVLKRFQVEYSYSTIDRTFTCMKRDVTRDLVGITVSIRIHIDCNTAGRSETVVIDHLFTGP
jgi:hypothetical protein